jgi:hypothetical protein
MTWFLFFIAIFGYAIFPSQMRGMNRKFPFEGAYDWLNRNARKNEVVLTASVLQVKLDYLLLYTDLRAYFSAYGSYFCMDQKANEFRKKFFYGLLLGFASKIKIQGIQSMPDKIKHLRLDYVLIGTQSPYLATVEDQLKPYLVEVFRNDQCKLWRVKVA